MMYDRDNQERYMENRSELSDIVLEKGSNRPSNLKRILIIVAFLVLIFLIALASMKMMNKDPKKDPSKLILPPENNATQEVPATKDDQLFKQVPIIEENPKQESFENMIKTLKEKEAQKQEEAKAQQEQTMKETPKEETPKRGESAKQPKEDPKKTTQQPAQPKQPAASTPTQQPKQPAASSSQPKAPATASTGNIYIQVAALSSTPDPKVLSNIKAKGYEYKLHPVNVNGKQITKILIGPYAKSEDAQTALISVKANVNKDAFISKVK